MNGDSGEPSLQKLGFEECKGGLKGPRALHRGFLDSIDSGEIFREVMGSEV